MAVRVCTRTATDTVYCVLHGYSDRVGVGEIEWQYVYSTRTATVTVSYTDTLTEGG